MSNLSNTDDILEALLRLDRKQLGDLLVRLNAELGDEGGLAGVGVPVFPTPNPVSGAAEVDLPEDYWETAQ